MLLESDVIEVDKKTVQDTKMEQRLFYPAEGRTLPVKGYS